MVHRVLLSVLFWAATSAAHAAPFSIRCTDANSFLPLFATYFATFEIDSLRVVFEPGNVGGPTSHLMAGGPFPGVIRDANDDRITFSVTHGSSTRDLVWDRRQRQLLWAGGDDTKPIAIHPCVVVPIRTLLSEDEDELRRPPESRPPFSIRCTNRWRAFYFTLDTWTKKAILESWHFGGYYRGVITGVDGNRVTFRLDLRGPQGEFVWDGTTSTMAYESVSGHGTNQKEVDPCTNVDLRTVMVYYCQDGWPGPRDPMLCRQAVP